MRVRGAFLLLCSALTFASCGGVVDFESPTALGDGIRGKAWGTQYFVEPELYRPGVKTKTVLTRSYDAVVNGETIQLAGAFLDPVGGKVKVYSRTYTNGGGWSPIGSGFQAVAASTVDLDLAAIGKGPSGLVFAAGASSGASGDQTLVTALYSGTAWQSSQTRDPTGQALLPNPFSSVDVPNGPFMTALMDTLGRGYVFGMATGGAPIVSTWQPATAPSTFSLVDAVGGTATNGSFNARYDGLHTICVSAEIDVTLSTLKVACGDTTLSTFGATFATVSSGGTVYGHDFATDSMGGFMAVYYLKDSSGHYHLYANHRSTVGSFDGQEKIDSIMVAPYYAVPDVTGMPLVRPGVTHIGGGNYLAAWVAADNTNYGTTADPIRYTQIYYALYEAGIGWTTTDAVLPVPVAYKTKPSHQALHLFGNEEGNAGIAVNTITAEAASPLGQFASNEIRKVTVARWQYQNGWLAPSVIGNGCQIKTSSTPGCTQRPTGSIFESGNTVVLYQDQDNDNAGENGSQGAPGAAGTSPTPGNSRLAGVDFK